MVKRRSDGSIQSTNTPDSRFSRQELAKDFGMYRCIITKVHYLDDPENFTFQNRQVTYSAIVLGGRKEGTEIDNIKSAGLHGGQYNYDETIWRPVNYKSQGLSNKPLAQQDGDIVLVQYIQGDPSLPVIICGMTQMLDLDSTGATREDGPISKKEYNGLFNFINKDGEFFLVRKGGVFNTAEHYFKPQDKASGDPDIFEAKMTWTDNLMIWEDPQNSLKFNKSEKKVTLDVGLGKIITEYDGENEKTTHTFESGLTITVDGKLDNATIATSSGQELIIDGATQKITLSSNFIDIGNAVSDFAVLFAQLAAAYNTHTHDVIVTGGSSAGTYTSLVTTPLPPTVASLTIKVQA